MLLLGVIEGFSMVLPLMGSLLGSSEKPAGSLLPRPLRCGSFGTQTVHSLCPHQPLISLPQQGLPCRSRLSSLVFSQAAGWLSLICQSQCIPAVMNWDGATVVWPPLVSSTTCHLRLTAEPPGLDSLGVCQMLSTVPPELLGVHSRAHISALLFKLKLNGMDLSHPPPQNTDGCL